MRRHYENVRIPAHTIHMAAPELLAFEETCTVRGQAKDERIRTVLGIPPARYYMLLHRAIDTTEALETNPMLVKRLRRMRDARLREQQRRVSRAG
jgi:hypothetical protein